MLVSFRIAVRYFLSKHSLNVINLISRISTIGVMIATASLVIILSVFNGLEKIIISQFNAFNPDLKISINKGKYISIEDSLKHQIEGIANIKTFSFTFEDLAIIKYDDQIHPFIVKGVDNNFIDVSGIDTMLLEGKYQLQDHNNDYAIVGYQIAQKLSIGIHFINPIIIYAPKRTNVSLLNPSNAFNKTYLFASGIFGVDDSADDKLLIPLHLCQKLYEADNLATNIEIKLKNPDKRTETQKELQDLLGSVYSIQTQKEQNNFHKILNAERFMIYLILSLILLIAGINIIAMITMLIVDKKDNFLTFQSLGLTRKQIKFVFLFTGWMTSISGAILGLFLGGILSWMQIKYSLIEFGNGDYGITTYPIDIVALDFIWIFLLVIVIGFLTSLIPIRNFEKNYLT